MCTAVDGGSIHRAARRISAASDQTSTTPMTSHRTKDRRERLRSGLLGSVSGVSLTFQNNSLGWVAGYGDFGIDAPSEPFGPVQGQGRWQSGYRMAEGLYYCRDAVTNILTIKFGSGSAIADGWATYSSRRWKTNIHQMQRAAWRGVVSRANTIKRCKVPPWSMRRTCVW